MRVRHTVQVYESIVHSIRKAHSAERMALRAESREQQAAGSGQNTKCVRLFESSVVPRPVRPGLSGGRGWFLGLNNSIDSRTQETQQTRRTRSVVRWVGLRPGFQP